MRTSIFMVVTDDEYELPMCVTDSVQELADFLGTTTASLYSRISKLRKKIPKRKHVSKTKMRIVEVELSERED